MNAFNEVGGIAPKTQQTFEKLQSKHPKAENITVDIQNESSPPACTITVDIKSLEETLQNFDPLTSSGPSRNSILFLISCLKVDGNKTLINELAAIIDFSLKVMFHPRSLDIWLEQG